MNTRSSTLYKISTNNSFNLLTTRSSKLYNISNDISSSTQIKELIGKNKGKLKKTKFLPSPPQLLTPQSSPSSSSPSSTFRSSLSHSPPTTNEITPSTSQSSSPTHSTTFSESLHFNTHFPQPSFSSPSSAHQMSPNKTYLSVAKTNQTNNNDKDWTITLFNKLWLQFNTKMTTVYSASQSSKPSATRSSPSIPQSSTFTPSISASIFISSTDSQHISTIIPIPTVNITSNKTFNSTPNSTFNTNSPSITITTTSTIDNDIYSITNPTPNHTFHLLNPTQLSNVTTKAIPTTNANIDANFKKSHLHDNVNASSTIQPTTDKAVSSTSFIHGQDNTNQINTAINSSTSSPILLCSNSLSPSTHEFLRSLHPPTSSLQNDPQDTSDTSDNNNIAAFPDAKIQKGNVNIIVQEIKSLISPFSQALPDQLSLQRHITEVDDFDDFVNYMTYLPTEPYITNLISQPTLNLSSLPIHNPHDTILLLDTLESEIIHESTFFHLYPNNSSTLNSCLHRLIFANITL